MGQQKSFPDLPRNLFWDTDFDQIDWEKNAPYVILRVLHRGSWKDFKTTLTFYGREAVKQVALGARHLDNRTLAFSSTYFQEPLKNFRCYKLRQLNPTLWDF